MFTYVLLPWIYWIMLPRPFFWIDYFMDALDFIGLFTHVSDLEVPPVLTPALAVDPKFEGPIPTTSEQTL